MKRPRGNGGRGRVIRETRRAAVILTALALGKAIGLSSAYGATARPGQILLQADSIMYDTNTGIVTAKGHVEITDDGRTLLADEVIYDEKKDQVSAKGNVSLQDATGNVAFADSVELTEDLRKGALQGFAAMIGENGRLVANSAERRDGRYTIAHAAVFTPCELCEDEGQQMPLWQIRASRVVHDQEEKEIYFDNATFSFLGLPIFYLPYFSQSDPTVTHKSGFLLPDFGSSSYMGSFVKVPYYVSLTPTRDLTIQPFFTTQAGNVLQGEYRERWADGGMWLQASIGYDSHAYNLTDRNAWVSSLFGSGRIPISDTWRAGFDVQLTSDDTFLQRYELSIADRLTTNLYADNIIGRNRLAIDTYFFQSLRTQDVPGQIPLALPLIQYTYIPDSKVVGGRLRLDTSALALTRDVGADVYRGSVAADWRRPFTTGDGQQFVFEGLARSDVYHITDATFDIPSATKNTETIGRGLGLAMVDWEWPFIGDIPIPDSKLVVSPIAQLIVASGGGNPKGLPDEDSASFEFDATNLFSPNPSPGEDLWTGGTRSNIGMRATALLPNGSIEGTIGEDFRTVPDPSFAPCSGFGGSRSDTVGQIKIQFPPHLTFTDLFNISPVDGTLRRN